MLNSHYLTFTARLYISFRSLSCVEMLHAPSVTPIVAPHNGRVISVHGWRRDCVLASRLHVPCALSARLVVTVGIAFVGAVTLLLGVGPDVAQAAQACGNLGSGQSYCLTKTDSVDPLRVGDTVTFTITESLTTGTIQVVDTNPLTDLVPANFNVTDLVTTRTGSATGPACTRAGNTVSCPGTRTLGPAAGQLTITITATAVLRTTTNNKCESVNNTVFTGVAGAVVNQVTEPTTVLPQKGPRACGLKSNDEEEDDDPKLTKEQRKQRERTNTSNHDQEKTEGNVVGVRCSGSDPELKVKRGFISKPDETPYVLIGTEDGVQQVVFTKGVRSRCKEIQVGDYLEAEGAKEHEQLFYADHDIEIRHR